MKDLPDSKIIDDTMLEQARFYGASPMAKLIENEQMIKFLTRIPDPFFNYIVSFKCNYTDIEKEIKRFISYGVSGNTSLSWMTAPSSESDNIKTLLEKNGFKYDSKMTSMAINISDLNGNLRIIPGLKIEMVDSREKLKKWVHACFKGFGVDSKNEEKIYEFEETLGCDKKSPIIRFNGMINSKVVGTSLVFKGSKAAGIDGITTKAKWRKKGIGASMVAHTLNFAYSTGYRIATLQASDMGINLYKYLGFKGYEETKEYIWKNNKKDK